MAGHALVLYDGACGLCTGIAGMLARRDRHQALTLLPIQGREAAEALARIGAHLPEGWQSDPDSMIVVAEGRMHQRSDAALEIARRLPRPWPWLRALRAVPRPVRDGAYRLVARTRRAWSGTAPCPHTPRER